MSRRPPRQTGRWWFAVVLAGVLIVPLAGCSLFENDDVDVLLVGDSIMRQSGEFVEQELQAQPGVGGAVVSNEGIDGSGLLTPKVFDWHTELPEMLETQTPEVAVVTFVGNYTDTDLYVNAAGQPVEPYTDEFWEAWAVEADRLMQIFTDAGVSVFWVLPPPMGAEEFQRRASELKRVYEELAGRWPGTNLIDGPTALGGPNGEFEAELPGPEGTPEIVRLIDGVHLTDAGSRRLATEIAEKIAPTVIERKAEGTAEGTAGGS